MTTPARLRTASRFAAGLCIATTLIGLPAPLDLPTARAAAADDAQGLDVVWMEDGRELKGRVIEERTDDVLFELHVGSIRSEIVLLKREIVRIERSAPAAEKAPERQSSSSTPMRKPDDAARTVGARQVASSDAKSLYVVPMRGQMGTDVNASIYERIIADIEATNPDVVVIQLDCDDSKIQMFEEIIPIGEDGADKGYDNSDFLDEYRKLMDLFHDRLRDRKQVVWVKNSVGISSIIALSWNDIYVAPDGRLGGLVGASANFMRVAGDFNMFGKYREAYMAWLKGFVENSDHDLKLVDAMVRPEMRLSATWKGRDVDWNLSPDGEYIVDNDEKATADFNAKRAEDFCISDGTAEDLDDLALLMGLREYVVVDGQAEKIFEDHRTDWRRAYQNAKDSLQRAGELQQQGGDAARVLGQVKSELEKVVAAIRRYDAVRLRLMYADGITEFRLLTQIEQIEEQLRALRRQERDNGTRRGGRAAPGGGLGAGG